MITIIFAPPRTGKTCFMTHCLREIAFNRERNRKMIREISNKNRNGFNLTMPIHCVSSNYSISFRKFRYSPRLSRVINPFRLGFDNKFVKTHFNYPYEAIGITEAQKYLNSRMSLYFPEWQYREVELISKTSPSSDWSLQLDSMKLESLVILNQNVRVNTFPGVVHTARHAMGARSTQSQWPNRKEGAA